MLTAVTGYAATGVLTFHILIPKEKHSPDEYTISWVVPIWKSPQYHYQIAIIRDISSF